MKKCPYCGKEYPDEATHCERDNYLLGGNEPPVIAEAMPPPLLSEPPPPRPAVGWRLPRFTERQMLILEILIVCVIAFGGGVLTSIFSLVDSGDSTHSTSGRSDYAWIVQFMRQSAALGLVWYLLLRRGKVFSDLGLKWAWKDIPLSIVIYLLRGLAFRGTFHLIMLFGLSSADIHISAVQVNRSLFGDGVSFIALANQFLNPFFEELIVRAYLMTEIKALTNSATIAIIISTVVQMSYHFYQGVPAAISHGVAFLVYSIYYAKTNRITPIVLSHLYVDVGVTLRYVFRS